MLVIGLLISMVTGLILICVYFKYMIKKRRGQKTVLLKKYLFMTDLYDKVYLNVAMQLARCV